MFVTELARTAVPAYDRAMTHADRKSPRWIPLLGLAVLCLSACTHRAAPKPLVPTKAAARATPDAGSSMPPALDAAGEAKLADAYHAIRCVMVGAALPKEMLYRELGFDDGPAFAAAFSAQATRNLAWASKTVADSLAKPCRGESAPAAPTPTTAP